MLTLNVKQAPKTINFQTLPVVHEAHRVSELDQWLSILNNEASWFDRRVAAGKLGRAGNPAAVPGLLQALESDPFWMVRCAIIEALEMIGDPRAIAPLRLISKNDGFQMVRSYAVKAIERITLDR